MRTRGMGRTLALSGIRLQQQLSGSYQVSIQMAPCEALYERPCRSSICWIELGKSSISGPDLVRDTS